MPLNVLGTGCSPDRVTATEGSPDRVISTEGSPDRVISMERSPNRMISTESSPDRVISMERSPDRMISTESSPDRVHDFRGRFSRQGDIHDGSPDIRGRFSRQVQQRSSAACTHTRRQQQCVSTDKAKPAAPECHYTSFPVGCVWRFVCLNEVHVFTNAIPQQTESHTSFPSSLSTRNSKLRIKVLPRIELATCATYT